MLCRDKKKKKGEDGEDGSGGGDDDDDENGDANGKDDEDEVVWMTDTSEAAAQVCQPLPTGGALCRVLCLCAFSLRTHA
jgi:hypothetical protein